MERERKNLESKQGPSIGQRHWIQTVQIHPPTTEPVQESVTSCTTHLTRTRTTPAYRTFSFIQKVSRIVCRPCWLVQSNNHTCRKMSALAIMSASVDPCTCGIAAALGLRTQYTNLKLQSRPLFTFVHHRRQHVWLDTIFIFFIRKKGDQVWDNSCGFLNTKYQNFLGPFSIHGA